MASHGIPRVSSAAIDKSEKARAQQRQQISQYRQLEKDVLDRIKANDYSNTTLQSLSALLRQNPEYYTIWNHRRLLLQHVFNTELKKLTEPSSTANEDADADADADALAAQKAGLNPAQHEIHLLILEDLRFLIPLLKQYPKCYWIWNHRLWLLDTATLHLPTSHALELWRGELALVSKMLNLDSRNFHGWGYRRQVVRQLERLGGKSLVEDEFAYTTKMIETNLSNFSAWHNRTQLIPRLLTERNAASEERQHFFEAEIELITTALYTDPYDQSLWFYHQYLMSTLDAANERAPPILDPCTNAERVRYLEQEIGSVRELLEGAEDCKYIYQALLEYSRQYLEVEAGNKRITTLELTEWLAELRKLDPLREGRWKDLERKMHL